jgi:hypothetical protein
VYRGANQAAAGMIMLTMAYNTAVNTRPLIMVPEMLFNGFMGAIPSDCKM